MGELMLVACSMLSDFHRVARDRNVDVLKMTAWELVVHLEKAGWKRQLWADKNKNARPPAVAVRRQMPKIM